MEYVWFILIGLAAGWLAGQLMEGGGFGIVGDIIIGVIGALLGGFLFRTLGVSAGPGLLGSVIVATIGAVVFLFLLRVITKGKSALGEKGSEKASGLALKSDLMSCYLP